MLFNILTASALFAATSLAKAEPAAFPAPYKLGKMSLNQAMGLMGRQNQGYQPTQTQCGPGSDCPSSCGADTVQCASNDDELHCYEPSLGETCCPDGSGNACDQGYYCTDNSDGTWCCPNGLDLTSCAALYSLTGALTSEATVAPTSSLAPTSPASVSVSVSATPSSGTVSVSTTPKSSSSSSTTPTASPTQVSNGTTTTTTAAQFTGAANQLVYGGLPALALAAGAVLAL